VNLFNNPGAPGGSFGYIAFAQSTAPNNQTLYTSVQGAPYAGFFKSTNGGANWFVLADAANRSAENMGCQCGYDLTLGVDPQDANRVYIGFQELYVSTDGGTNFGTPAISQNKIHWTITRSPSVPPAIFPPARLRGSGSARTEAFTVRATAEAPGPISMKASPPCSSSRLILARQRRQQRLDLRRHAGHRGDRTQPGLAHGQRLALEP